MGGGDADDTLFCHLSIYDIFFFFIQLYWKEEYFLAWRDLSQYLSLSPTRQDLTQGQWPIGQLKWGLEGEVRHKLRLQPCWTMMQLGHLKVAQLKPRALWPQVRFCWTLLQHFRSVIENKHFNFNSFKEILPNLFAEQFLLTKHINIFFQLSNKYYPKLLQILLNTWNILLEKIYYLIPLLSNQFWEYMPLHVPLYMK